ncbi:hypothetical protein [Streptomyces pristinaespiralis]|uniref:hypothetical protein n=1 Tax=Streptomyces pristinaespiralis TaxID=38300 RepID=UPI00384BD9FE
MAHDLLDPGPDYNGRPAYLNWPRNTNGEPCFSDTHSAADVVFPPGSTPAARGYDTMQPLPFAYDYQRKPWHEWVAYREKIDLTLYGRDGQPINPPVIPLDVVRQMHVEHYG